MQTNEPLNTASIQAFIQQVKGAEASRSKDIRMDISQAKNLAFTLGIVMARLNGDLEQIIEWCNNNQEKCEYIAFMSKAYALQFFNKEKEEQIIKSVIDFYYEKTHQNVL